MAYPSQVETLDAQPQEFGVKVTGSFDIGYLKVRNNAGYSHLSSSGVANGYYPGRCATTGPEAIAAGQYISSHMGGGGFSFTNGLKAVADYGAGIANFATSTATFGQVHVSAPYCGFSWASDVGFGYGVVATSLLGVGEVDAAAGTTETANEGVYVVDSSEGTYVGQSGNIDARLADHIANGKFSQSEVDGAQRISVQGGRTAREIVEQRTIDEFGGTSQLLNIRNPIGVSRFELMGPGYSRP